MSQTADFKGANVLVLIALEEEFRSVAEVLPFTLEERILPSDREVFLGLLGSDGKYGIAFHWIGGMGMEKAARAVREIIPYIDPDLVVSMGLSGALTDERQLGDLVLATSTEDYLSDGKIVDDSGNEIEIRWAGEPFRTDGPAHRRFLAYFRRARDGHILWQRRAVQDLAYAGAGLDLSSVARLKRNPELVSGPVACGPVVVSSVIFRKLLLEKNRKFIAVDMESAGVASELHALHARASLLVLRGLSDHADPNKSELDRLSKGRFRSWVMRSATLALLQGLNLTEERHQHNHALPNGSDTSDDTLRNHFHSLAIKEFLPAPFSDDTFFASRPIAKFEPLFDLLTSGSHAWRGRWIEASAQHVLTSKENLPLEVQGLPGSGKTTFLSLLYWRLREIVRDRPGIVVAYISVARYTAPEHSLRLSPREKPFEALRRHLSILSTSKLENRELIVLVDGLDPATTTTEYAATEVLRLLEEVPHQKVIGTRRVGGTGAAGKPGSQHAWVRLKAVNTDHREDAEQLCERFVEVASARVPATPTDLLRRASSFRLADLDLFTLSLLCESEAPQPVPLNDEMAALIEAHCISYVQSAAKSLQSQEAILNRAAKLAFRSEVGEDIDTSGEEEDTIAWHLVRRHTQIANYLTGRFIVDEVIRIGRPRPGGSARHLGFVYPYRINRFSKAIIQRDRDTQKAVLRGIRGLLRRKSSHEYAKAHAAYLAGRVWEPQLKEEARRELRRFLTDLPDDASIAAEPEPRRRFLLLLVRTVYISLAYLDDSDAIDEYVAKLLKYPEWDRFNRGFHLEYYGDRTYSPDKPLLSDDNLQPCPLTIQQLTRRLSSPDGSPLQNIELQTLLSLSQHRHVAGTLDEHSRQKVLDLIDHFGGGLNIEQDRLRAYMQMISDHLRKPHFVPGSVVLEAHNLKSVSRAGWSKRGLTGTESVADHTMGAYLLALFLLPRRRRGGEYDKDRILRMLLVHDLAESRYGDYLPEQGGETKTRQEGRYFDELWVIGTYGGIADLENVKNLWREYEAATTLNALIARDFDKLENLVQLYRYVSEGAHIADAAEWEKQLLESVRTDVGREALRSLKQSFTQIGALSFEPERIP